MNIRSVTAFPLQYPEPHDHGKLRYITLARVEATDGTVGWGECISQFPESAEAVKLVIEEGFAPLLVGENSTDIEHLRQKMLKRVWWYGPQGIAAFGISAVDMALWDLHGHLSGKSVSALLADKPRPRVSVMSSIHLDLENVDWTLREFAGFRDEGYTIVKGGWGKRPEAVFGKDRKRDTDLVRLIRETIGDRIDLVIDVLGAQVKWDLPTAIERFRDLRPYRLLWVEEPLPPSDYDAHVELKKQNLLPIGTGEQEWNPDGYGRLVRAGGVDIVQMDPGRCHGISGCRDAIKLVEDAKLKFSAHTWSSALNTAASVHLVASSPAGFTLDFKPHESPMQHELVADPWVQKDGHLDVRSKPGLGVTVREDVVRKYAYRSSR